MKSRMNIQPKFWAVAVLALTMALAACGGDSSTTESDSSGTNIPAYGPSIAMTLPDTMTGGAGVAPASAPFPGGLIPMARGLSGGANQPMAGQGDPCAFLGHGSGDPFRNGHTMTKFLVGAIASWSCIADNIVRFVDILVFYGVPTDGTEFDITDADYEAGDPTYVSINEISATLTEVKLYWTVAPGTPPIGDDTDVGFFMVWDTSGGNVDGRLIVELSSIADGPVDPTEDPAFLRLDFNKTGTLETGDMYLGFDVSNTWVQGWNIHVTKQDDGSFPRYLAKGVLGMTAQWDPAYELAGYLDTPALKSYAVANNIGTGAAIASMVDLGFILSPVDTDNDHLGTFLFTKDDRYYFGGGSPVVKKTITSATYKGDRNILNTAGGFINSPADIDFFLGTGTDYVDCTNTPGTTSAACANVLNALFAGGDFGAEANVGTEPLAGDQRRDALDAATYANDACPGGTPGCVWDTTDVFAMSYP